MKNMNKGGGKTFVNENIFGQTNIYKKFQTNQETWRLIKKNICIIKGDLTKYLTKVQGGQYLRKLGAI